jgi:hypothetical protein
MRTKEIEERKEIASGDRVGHFGTDIVPEHRMLEGMSSAADSGVSVHV